MRRNGALAADYARRHGVARWHDDADAIIRAPDIDAVYIATLTDTHRDYTLRCAAAGKPVYVEKPMAMNHAECLDMIAACRAAGVPLWVGYYRRALPRFLAVRDLIAGGAIGEVRMVISRQFQRLPGADQFAGGAVPWRVDPELSGGGFFFEARLPHVRFSRFPVRADRRRCAPSPAIRRAPTARKTSSPRRTGSRRASTAAATWCYAADFDEEYNEIVGAKGRIRFSTSQPVPIRIFRGETVEEFPVGDPHHVHQPLIQTIVDELNGSGKCPSTGESAARTAQVMDAILAEFRAQAPDRHPGQGHARRPPDARQ